MLADELGDSRSNCGRGDRGLRTWVGRDDKSDGGYRGVDGSSNGEGEEPVHSVPDIRVYGCRICGKHMMDHFDDIIGWDAVHPRNSTGEGSSRS